MPDARFSWVVEEAFAPLVRLHPAVSEVIPVASRRWRAACSRRHLAEMARFARTLRRRHYDEIVDTQGLFFKSALMARLARGRRHGYDASSIRERAACCVLRRAPPRCARSACHRAQPRADRACARLCARRRDRFRALARRALRPTAASPTASCCTRPPGPKRNGRRHPGSRSGGRLGAVAVAGAALGNQRRTGAQRPDRGCAGRTRACPTGSRSTGWRVCIAGASFVIGVDTGLLHLAAALGVPLVAIFVGSEPGLTGPIGPRADRGGRRQGAVTLGGRRGRRPRAACPELGLQVLACQLTSRAAVSSASASRVAAAT